MAAPRTITVAERRARIGRRHALAAPVRAAEEAAAAVGTLHSSDPVTVHLSVRARTRRPGTADAERALYADRSLLRLHGMRRTLWVVPTALEPAVRVAGALPLVPKERKRLLAALAESAVAPDPAAWLAALEAQVEAAVVAAGELSAKELGIAVPGLGTKVLYGVGTKWPAEVSVASRLLTILGFEGRILRSRPLGTWVSGQYRYGPGPALTEGDLPDPAAARAAVVAAYVERFGPVTMTDVRWWTGWTVPQVKAALAGCTEVDVDGQPAFVAAGDDAPIVGPRSWVALLPSLDPTTMGWKERAWYLGDHGPTLFDRNGNAGPTVWVDGRVVGGWAQRPDGEVVVRLLDDVGADATRAVEAEAAALTTWCAGVAASVRFPSPLSRELSRS